MRFRMKIAALAAGGVLVASAAGAGTAGAMSGSDSASGCAATTSAGGGDWPNLQNGNGGSRDQTAEATVGPAQAATLAPAWTFKNSDGGNFTSTPVESDGCVFAGDSAGWAYALNAGTGALVWKRQLPWTAGGILGSGVPGAAAVADGKVFFLVSQVGDGKGHGPYAVALDEATGQIAWGPTVLDDTVGDYLDASPVLYNGMLFAGFNGDETYSVTRGGYAILDESSGQIIKHAYTIPDDRYKLGSSGGSIWATGAIDSSGFLYTGTSNPVNDGPEDANTDAIVKIDLNRFKADGVTPNPAFGTIVDSIRGNADGVVPYADDPACGKVPHNIAAPGPNGPEDGALSAQAVACTRNDSDYGGSPNLFLVGGRPAVGEIQKSGVYHAAYTDGPLSDAFDVTLSPWFFYGNLADTATDGKTIYAAAGIPGQLVAFDTNGNIKWITPIGDGVHFQPVAVANGVVYLTDSLGFLWGVDAANGVPVLHRQLAQDNGGDTSANSALSQQTNGVSVARHRLFLDGGDFVMSYAPSGSSSGSGVPALPVGPPAPGDTVPHPALGVAAGPGASTAGFATPTVVIPQGSTLTFANGDTQTHGVASTATKPDGAPLFGSSSGLTPSLASGDVPGVASLPPGTYSFYCPLHAHMTGTLIVQPRSIGQNVG